MLDNFIHLKVVETELVSIEEFVLEFKKQVEQKKFPIRIKIDEGPDISNLKIGNKNFVDYLCGITSAQNIEIETDNLLQDHKRIKIIKFFNELPFLCHQNYIANSKKFQRKFMHFVGNHRWPRFVLSHFLYKDHKAESFLTYWFANHLQKRPPELLNCMSQKDINEYYKILPLKIDTKEQCNHDGYIDWEHTNPLLEFYDNAFLDIVCETWHEGSTFMPTEKIARPMACMNPFIVYGPKYFLKNLKKLGFKTFEKFWSEDYDDVTGKERIKLIKDLVSKLAKISYNDTQILYEKLLPTLQHNKKIYNSLTKSQIMSVFDK